MENNFVELIMSLPVLTKVVMAFIAAIWGYFFFFKFNARTVSNAPTVLTSVGIFGTFLGVAIGLSDFNTEDIRSSVPTLIDGLKTAFWSSVMGIFCALTIKIRHLYEIQKITHTEESHGATIDDIVNQLSDVNKALIGEEESTLLSQIKLMRQDSNDKLDGLRQSMEDFIKNMAENNSKALIEALNEVIRDFNAKINEQFGENFKQLNEAVGKMLEWQERYKLQMEEMIAQQQITADSMVTATKNYEDAVENTSRFSEVANDLSEVVKILELQREHIHNSVKELALLIESAKTGLPDIETKITQLVTQVTQGVQNNSDAMEEAINSSAKNMDNLLTQSNTRFNKHIDEISEKTRTQVTELDKAMSEELTKALESFGRQLTALSEKFVSDYTPLTEKLRKLVSVSRDY